MKAVVNGEEDKEFCAFHSLDLQKKELFMWPLSIRTSLTLQIHYSKCSLHFHFPFLPFFHSLFCYAHHLTAHSRKTTVFAHQSRQYKKKRGPHLSHNSLHHVTSPWPVFNNFFCLRFLLLVIMVTTSSTKRKIRH